MRYFRAGTLFALSVAFMALAAWWMLNVVPATWTDPRMATAGDGFTGHNIGLLLGGLFVTALPAMFASLCFHGARRQLKRREPH